ncbi:MAG: glycosyltransferase [Rhodobacteraceae bacterium]|nr:MAG: glycosyltransferase [Paracoccaceae bacterium]
MFQRLVRLFDRYAARHGRMSFPGFSLIDTDGAVFGHLDRIEVAGARYIVTGWALSGRIGLGGGDEAVSKAPDLVRDDVIRALGQGFVKTPGFSVSVSAVAPRLHFWADHGGAHYVFPLPVPDERSARRLRRRLVLPFAAGCLRALPAAMRWQLRRDPAAVARIKSVLGLSTIPQARHLNAHLFQDDAGPVPPPPASLRQNGITIILPVYNAFDLLPDVLDRVQRHTDLPWHLIIVEDASPDRAVRPWLRAWIGGLPEGERARVTLIENETNQGFIRSVNSAFARAIPLGQHVVLLNSDAFVPRGWASRLIRPILEHQNVATVTPMSNDAEIFTAPAICNRLDLAPGLADAIDRVAQRFCSGADLADAPTGVGFCMAMNIDFLRRADRFDTGFGRGYGEEVDWCQRVAALGGRHLGLAGLFVEHRGGRSFGDAEKMRLVRQNNKTISRRYPGYNDAVLDFIRDDPLATPRLALAFAWAAQAARGALPVYLAHSLGGGAEMDLQRRVQGDLDRIGAAVILRVGGQARFRVELHSPVGISMGDTDGIAFVRRLLGLLKGRRIVYSCGVGDPDPIALPDILCNLAAGAGDRVEVLVHDFFPLSPSYTLLGRDGIYHGLPSLDDPDPAHRILRPDGQVADLADWRAAWGRLMTRADAITVFSDNSRHLVARAYPGVRTRIAVTPHRLITDVPRIPVAARWQAQPVIGVLGNIGHQKGAGVLRDLSAALSRSRAARLVVIGDVDPAYELAGSAHVHGAYRVEDLPALVRKYGISCWLIPSIWPETFSFTTHEAVATGLPVWSFDLGAQGDTVAAVAARTGLGGTLPLIDGRFDIDMILANLLAQPRKVRA